MGREKNSGVSLPKLTREQLELATRQQLIKLILLLQEQNKQIAVLKARVVELERQLGLDSSNSSKPPSSDTPGSHKRRRRKKKSKRKRGAQPGHTGHHRQLIPQDKVNHLNIIKPKFC